jgi:hypothetical protein
LLFGRKNLLQKIILILIENLQGQESSYFVVAPCTIQQSCQLPKLYTIYFHKKRAPEGTLEICEKDSHEVLDTNTSVVHVLGSGKSFSIGNRYAISVNTVEYEWVSNHTVTGLEANLRLEGVRINAT